MIEIACHTWCFPDLTVSEALGTIARLGFRRADIAPGSGLSLARMVKSPRAVADEIRADCALYNLTLSDLFLMLPRISTDDAARRDKEIDTFAALMPCAALLGVGGVTVSPGVAHAPDDAAAWDRSIEALTRMRDAARAAGVAFSFAPHVDSMAASPERARDLLDALDGAALTLDWPSLVYGGAKVSEIAPLIGRSRHMHLRGAAKGQLQAAGDRSRIDFNELFEELIIRGYDGTIAVSLLADAGRHRVTKLRPGAEAVRLRDSLRAARDAVMARRRG